MKYTKAQFLKDVAAEAKALKKNATKEELNDLSVETLDPSNRYKCIYGMATGNCRNDRAIKLIQSCCVRSVYNLTPDFGEHKISFTEVAEGVNGKKIDPDHVWQYLSALETYIQTDLANPRNLIAYLKDERKDLVL